MEISDLRIFQTVAEEGSVSQAAKRLNYVQSNVTARIQQVEKELGTSLFYRHRRGVTLNEDGRKLLGYTQKMLALMEEMQQSFQTSEDPSGPLLIGSVETVSALPMILASYHKQFPRVDLSLVSGVTQHLVSDVLHYQLDGAFVSGPIQHPDIVQEHVMEEELVLVAARGIHSLEECKRKPLLVFRSGCGYRARLTQWLSTQGITPTKIMEFGTLETILAVVESGLGISLVPKSTVLRLHSEGNIGHFTLPEGYNQVTTVFIRRKDSFLTNTMRCFLNQIDQFHEQRIHA
ncbi:LysR family transcriptional regulator [Brevibacillus laterosporus]|nr:LysR family transcriptional regulator [Brevibacillus laterosporus]TPG82454.1 LysR family transcriptional regulator [Brevibacillus laterosporus]